MIISRKKYEESIAKAVDQKLREYDERRFLDDRLRDMDRSFGHRMDRMYERIRKIEEVVFPEQKEESCCENARCGY